MIAQTHLQGSIDSLADYLGYGKAENNNRVENRDERVAWETGRNLGGAKSIGAAKRRFKQAAARKGRQVEKPVYQVILSWQSGNVMTGTPPDDPSQEEMRWAADEVLSELGLEGHQAWIVAHRDTSTPHIHIVVNRVHPRTGETWSRSYDQSILYNTLREIEEKKGWHRPGPMKIEDLPSYQQENLEYWEEESEKLGRERSVRRWAREEGIPDLLQRVETWEQAERLLHGTGATLKPRREQGMVIERDGGHAALSSIDPTISRPKLEARYGETWESYRERQQSAMERLSEKLSSSSPTEEQLKIYRRVEKVEALRQAEKNGTLPKLVAQKEEARVALVAASSYLRRNSENPAHLRKLMEQLPGTEAEILKNARSWGASWAAGISLTGQQKKVLRKAWSIQHTRESHGSEDSGPNDDWAREELRSALENLEEEDFRALIPVLEMEKRIEDRIRRVMEEKGQASEQARGARVDGVQEVLLEQWEVLSSRLPEEQLSRPQKEALRSLDALREEVKKTPYDYGPQRDRVQAQLEKEAFFQRNLKKLDKEEVDELREHLEGEDLRIRDLNEHRRTALKKQADKTAADATGKIEDLLQDGNLLEAREAFVQARSTIGDIEKEIRDIEEEFPESGSWDLKSESLDNLEGTGLKRTSLKDRFERQLEKTLSVEDRSRLELGTAEAKAKEDRARRGAQEEFEALGPGQKKAVRCCEVAARLEGPQLAQEQLEKAAGLLVKMDTARREEASQVIGEKGQWAFDEALDMARELEQDEQSEDEESPHRERSRGPSRGWSHGR